MTKLQVAIKLVKDYNKILKEKEKAILKDKNNLFRKSFDVFFEMHPEVKSVSWTQYSPYFNDGDPSYFSANISPSELRINGELIENEDYDEDEVDEGEESLDKSITKPAAEDAYKIISLFDERFLEDSFGGSHDVTVTKTKIKSTEYYDHD